jgi:hypothetical protein
MRKTERKRKVAKTPTVSLRRQALRAIAALITRVDKRTANLYEADRMEDWIYSELYLRNLRKARELLAEPTRGNPPPNRGG